MSITVQSIVDRVQIQLQDTTGIRWPEDELVMWLNDSQREIVLYKPDAGAMNDVVALVQGTRQDIPAVGNRLLRVVRNMGTDDLSAPGRAVRIVSREILDAQYPEWHNATESAKHPETTHGSVIKHYCYDEQDPRHFYVFPGIAGSAWLEIVYSHNPDPVSLSSATGSTNLTIPDIFANAVVDYVMYRAYMKDAEYSANNDRAQTHFALFMSSVTGKAQLDLAVGPNSGRDVVGRASVPAGA